MPSNYQQPTNGPRPNESKLGAKAHETTEKLKDTAVERVSEARHMAEAQKEQLADRVRRVGSAVREAGDRLRDEDQLLGRYAGFAADGIERAASYLSTADPKAAIQDVESFARRKPALFFGGAFLIGLAAGRFLKSSQHHEGSEGPDYWASGGEQGSFGFGEPDYGSQSDGSQAGSEVAGYGGRVAGGYPSERTEGYQGSSAGPGMHDIFDAPEQPNIGTTPEATTDPGIGNTSRGTGGGSSEKG